MSGERARYHQGTAQKDVRVIYHKYRMKKIMLNIILKHVQGAGVISVMLSRPVDLKASVPRSLSMMTATEGR